MPVDRLKYVIVEIHSPDSFAIGVLLEISQIQIKLTQLALL